MSYVLKTQLAHPSNYKKSNRKPNSSYYIVWHYTANDGDNGANNATYFQTPNLNTSANYFADDDFITMSVDPADIAYAVGGKKWTDTANTGGGRLYGIAKNANCISIEVCDTKKDGIIYPTEKTLNNAIELTASLMKTYNIPLDHVIRHFDITGKHCPVWAMDETSWHNIKARITQSYMGTPLIPPEPLEKETETKNLEAFNKQIKDLQWSFNQDGFTDKNGNKVKEDGYWGILTDSTARKVYIGIGAEKRYANTVSWVQIRTGSKADGYFGNDTDSKVKAYKTAHGLSKDGVIDPTLMFELIKGCY